MRVKELTDSTVRYYHQIVLPVPRARDGQRDYGLAHVARLVRIRWLAQAGVPLATIAAVLGAVDDDGRPGDGESGAGVAPVLADLRATATGLADQLAELLYEDLTEERLAESYALYCQIAERRTRLGSIGQDEIDKVAASVVDRISRHLGPDRAKTSAAIDVDTTVRDVRTG